MSRCWGCCQENCDSGPEICSCSCHRGGEGLNPILTKSTVPPCGTCGKILCEGTHVKYPCNEHKRYQAKRKPTGNCEACWRYYVKVNP